jgi:hypothetical protein
VKIRNARVVKRTVNPQELDRSSNKDMVFFIDVTLNRLASSYKTLQSSSKSRLPMFPREPIDVCGRGCDAIETRVGAPCVADQVEKSTAAKGELVCDWERHSWQDSYTYSATRNTCVSGPQSPQSNALRREVIKKLEHSPR